MTAGGPGCCRRKTISLFSATYITDCDEAVWQAVCKLRVDSEPLPVRAYVFRGVFRKRRRIQQSPMTLEVRLADLKHDGGPLLELLLRESARNMEWARLVWIDRKAP